MFITIENHPRWVRLKCMKQNASVVSKFQATEKNKSENLSGSSSSSRESVLRGLLNGQWSWSFGFARLWKTQPEKSFDFSGIRNHATVLPVPVNSNCWLLLDSSGHLPLTDKLLWVHCDGDRMLPQSGRVINGPRLKFPNSIRRGFVAKLVEQT